MKRLTNLVICAAAAAVPAACSDPLATAPDADGSAVPVVAVQRALGRYELDFLDDAREQVTSLPFGQAVTLQATILDESGQPAQSGLVTFQYCSRKGYPTNDITRIDEAPTEACEVTGEGRWRTLESVAVNSAGIAERRFCCPQVTPAIGFRFKYAGRGSGIKDHTVPGEDFNWF